MTTKVASEKKPEPQFRAYWLTESIFVDHNKRCWVAMADEDGDVEQVCIGSEGTVKSALIKAGILEGRKKPGRKPKKPQKVIIQGRRTDKITYGN